MTQDPLIAISGTNGKTTTALLLEHILQSPSSPGTGTASPYSIKELGHGSAGETLSLLIITNISHPLPKWQLKENWNQCLRLVRKMKRDSIILLNADDQFCLALTDQTEAQVISYAVHYQQAMVTAREVARKPSGMYSFQLVLEEELPSLHSYPPVKPLSLKLEAPLWGEHNLYNTLAAATAALLLQKDAREIKTKIALFPGVKRQGKLVYHEKLALLDDRADNPPALQALMQEVARIPFNKLVMVKGLEPFTSSAQAQQAASVLCSWLKKIPLRELIFTPGYRFGQKLAEKETRREDNFLQYFRESGLTFQFIPEGVDAFYNALETAGEKDLLLLVGNDCLEQVSSMAHNFIASAGDCCPANAFNPS
ncbi:MAG: hypothetical protein GX767_05175 [Firmicutes bacterium]|nr:hypothetical protein [Bacillota bacterium]